jgi:subtilase family serine protease
VETSSIFSSKRAGLLTTTVMLLTPLMSMASAAPIWNAKLPSMDLGPLAATTQLTVTVWLNAHDQAAFDAAVRQRVTPGNANYHHWMTPAEVATYAATDEDVDALSAELQAAGLRIERRESDNSMIRVSGSADAIERAFGTTLHSFRHGEETYFRNTSEPRFAGAHAGLIAGITGLTNAHMSPFALPQIDPTTGKARAVTALRTLTRAPSAVTQCFSASKNYKLTRPGEGGATHGKWTGPSYSAPPENVCAYNASQIAAHYGLTAAYSQGLNGDGQTIVLVDAYGSPTIESDANNFSTLMGLPALSSSNFQIVYPDGKSTQNPYPTGWPVEISLDVEWAHAIAPNAKIVLVVAPYDDDAEMAFVLHYAIKHQLGTVISNSYGYPESEFGPAAARAFNHAIEQAAAQGINVDVSAGDSGDLGLGTPVGAASIPADSPYATAIGGTSLNVPSDNGPVESVWGITATYLADQNSVEVPADFLGFQQGSGGGESVYLRKPAWQSALPGSGRQLPDVAAVADPQTGVIIITPNSTGSESVEEVIGGTSVSSPVISGIWALAQQAANASLGQAAPIIATMPASALTDIVPIAATAANTLSGKDWQGTTVNVYTASGLLNLTATQPAGFVGTLARYGIGDYYDLGFGADSSLMTAIGWDDCTGYGVPIGLNFINAAASSATK